MKYVDILFGFVMAHKVILAAWAMRETRVVQRSAVWIWNEPGGLRGVTSRFLYGKPQTPPIEAKPETK